MMPIKVFFHKKDKEISAEPRFLKYICKDRDSIENEVVYCDKDDIEFIYKQWSFKFRGKKFDLKQYGHIGAGDFLGGHKNFLEYEGRSELLALRNLVYSKINYEIENVISALFSRYGISQN